MTTLMPSSGDPTTAKFIIITDYPHRLDVVRARPFSGPDGKELDKILTDSKIKRSDCYITYLFKDFSFKQDEYIQFLKGRPPIVTERGQQCIKDMYEEIKSCKSNIIITLGNFALYSITGRHNIYKWRGSILNIANIPGTTLIPTHHPNSITDGYQYLNKHLINFDLDTAVRIENGSFEFRTKNCIINPGYHQCLDFLDSCIADVRTGTSRGISYDIEVSNLEVSCISFASNKTDSICIPFTGPQGDYFNLDQETMLWIKITEILEDETIPKIGQNLVFDGHFNLRKYGIHLTNPEDTMILQHTIMPEYNKGLDFIASIWTDIPYYKEDGKFWLKGIGTWERGWEYNALDSLVCANAFDRQLAQVKKQGNLETYERTKKIILPLVYMMERGVRIDIEKMKRDFITTGETIKEIKQQLNNVAGRTLNANSPKQLKDYFYVEKGVKAYKKKGKDSTDEDAMKRLSRRGFKEAEIILNIRRKIKERSTYLNPEKVDKDGRMRCSYNPVGTRYSRLSSNETIFGTGNNLQNQPHNILNYFLADDGYAAYEIDLSQAENRIVAYVGRVISMIDAFETGKDVHCLTGALLSGKDPDEIKYEDGMLDQTQDKKYAAPMGSGDKSWRFWAKKANHGFNYDWGPDNFALKNEIPVLDGRKIYNGYHNAYPEIQTKYHGYVKTCLIKDRMLTNLMGRKTYFMDNLSDYRSRDAVFKAAYSCIPQGSVGDIINERSMNFTYYDSRFEKVELLMQVHDAIKFQIPLNIGWLKHAELLMLMKEELEKPLITHYGREFSIPADVKMGDNFGHMQEFKAKVIGSDRQAFAKMLETTWNKEVKNVSL